MRSPSVKAEKNPKKEALKYSVPRKKKRMADVKPTVRDTVSETISFVIKGKLTPIKPILIENKLNLLGKVNRRNIKEGKIVKKQRAVAKQTIATPVNKKQKQTSSKVKSKVQTKTAKKSAHTTNDKKNKILIDVISQTPKNLTKRTAKTEKPIKIAKKAAIRDCKPKKIKKESIGELPKATKKLAKEKKLADDKPTEEVLQKDTKSEPVDEKVHQEAKPKPVIKRKRTINVKPIKEKCVESKTIAKPKKVTQKQKQDPKVDKPPVKIIAPPPVVVKTEVPSPPPEEPCEPMAQSDPVKVKVEPEDNEQPVVKKRTYKKLKIQPKIQIVKKRVKSKNPESDGQICKTKLFGFWNGPKRHRVASLNALAKVQCLYDNEGKGNLLDLMEEQSRMEYLAKVESLKLAQLAAAKKEPLKSSRESSPEPPTRTLRSVPGLRAVGKHWEHSDSSSSSDESDAPVKQIKEEKIDAKEAEQEGEKQASGQKKKRGKNELVMDLKDMVVRKRMASLNATAILAASYSTEKRQTSKTFKNDDSSSDESGSSEEYFAANKTLVKEEVPEDDGKKEEDRKLVECILRKIQTEGLIKKYETEPEFALKMKFLSALAFVPTTDVVEAFEILCDENMLPEDAQPILDYFEDTWIGRPQRRQHRRSPRFSHSMWNCFNTVVEGLPKTNNSIEGWHRAFEAQSSADHPNIWKFVKAIQREQSLHELQIEQYVAVILNHQDTADVTITGVYVNSTTRSTRHEGYCSIAGMQYRISATSHTQTAAAAAVATAETLLRTGEASAGNPQQQENSYTPLDALSSMQPPSAPPGIHHHHHHQHVMATGPPPPPAQHVLHATHQLSPGLRHGCSSAFSSPHSAPGYHPPIQAESGYVHGEFAWNFLILYKSVKNRIVKSPSVKPLGININNKMSWHRHRWTIAPMCVLQSMRLTSQRTFVAWNIEVEGSRPFPVLEILSRKMIE
nr:unnamed protein product [Callosobruchus analis]